MKDIKVVSPSRLLVTDFDNQKIKMLDSANGRVLSTVSVPGMPRRICILRDGRVAVALTNVNKIQFIYINGDTLSLDGLIDVRDNPMSLSAFDHNRLVVSYEGSGRIEMITMEGRVVHDMDNDTAGQELFIVPNYITILKNSDIFISDWGTATITQMDGSLRIKQTFTSPMLTRPLGMVSLSSNQLLVADQRSHSIVVLNPSSGTVTPVLGPSDGIQEPLALAWCSASNKLYVGGCWEIKTVSVYSLT